MNKTRLLLLILWLAGGLLTMCQAQNTPPLYKYRGRQKVSKGEKYEKVENAVNHVFWRADTIYAATFQGTDGAYIYTNGKLIRLTRKRK